MERCAPIVQSCSWPQYKYRNWNLLKHDDLGMRVDRIKPESPADVWNAACEQSCPTDKLLIGDLIIQVNDISIQNGYQAMLDEFKLQLEFRLVVARQPVRSNP